MTFDELDKRYPSEFDDAEVTGVVVDYGKRTASFSLNMRLNPPDVPERDAYTQALIKLRGSTMCQSIRRLLAISLTQVTARPLWTASRKTSRIRTL